MYGNYRNLYIFILFKIIVLSVYVNRNKYNNIF